ncbi:MAG: SDR family oxidoreductase [Dehalococcoidia bacterium]|nr:MAG: SDR family oxidoreductase [bacterium]MCE7928942.1 SDR family oxidoreductase [Chloroflexi bacterium CFX7]MCK6564202.1 SDR family oxidoreductase [Dehalococcoidia bacterium]MCL4230283.1 SDR family oxidoreductase [Dehalococcoidia bacterium]NUQ54717.1 SDR family oxidoreductase [Dehalococcoidia bacterium]
MRLEGKLAIVTGAASGIGAATAALFAEEGARVLAVDLPGTRLARAHKTHSRVETLEADIAAGGAGARVVGEAVSRFGGLDILMNNAGVGSNAPAEDLPVEEWDRVFSVNVRGMFLLCQAAIPVLKRSKGGRIINIASVMAQRTDYGLSAYVAAKHAVAGLTKTLALELGRSGITCNYIEPGAIYTGMTKANFDQPHIREVWEKKSPLRRLGQPADIARGALYLASDDSSFVTGHGLVIDGGLTLRA